MTNFDNSKIDDVIESSNDISKMVSNIWNLTKENFYVIILVILVLSIISFIIFMFSYVSLVVKKKSN